MQQSQVLESSQRERPEDGLGQLQLQGHLSRSRDQRAAGPEEGISGRSVLKESALAGSGVTDIEQEVQQRYMT